MVPGTGYLSRIVVGPFWQWDVLKNAVCLLEPFEEATKYVSHASVCISDTIPILAGLKKTFPDHKK